MPELAASNKKSVIYVLHVDDDPSILEISKLMLTDLESNLNIDNACCVDEAFKKLSTGQYDVVVSDYEMPQKNGLEFLKELREQKNDVAFIIFTGRGREDVAVNALNLGADRYLNKNGSPEAVYGELAHAIKNLAERKKSKQLLRMSESKYRLLVEKSLQGIMIAQNTPLRVAFANVAMGKMLGYKPEELTLLSPAEVATLVHHEDRAFFFNRFKSRLEGKEADDCYEFRAVRKDGSIVWMEAFASQIEYNGEPAVQAMFMDIDGRKKNEVLIKKSEARYRELANFLPEIVFETDLTGKITFFSQNAFEISGFTPEELEKGMNMLQFIIPEDRERANENIRRRMAGEKTDTSEYTLFRKNGDTYPAIVKTAPILSENKLTGLRGLVIDITARKKNELELKQYNEVLESVSEGVDAGLAVIDRDYRVVWANKRLIDFGIVPNGKCYETFNNLGIICGPDCGVEKIFQNDSSLDVHEYKTVNSKGETSWVELRVTPLKDQNGVTVAALELAIPITERKKAEEKILWLASFPMHNPNPVLEVSFEGNISYFNSATESVFPDLKEAGLSHPLFSGWNNLLPAFRNEKTQTFGRNIKISDNWFHQQFNVHTVTQTVRIYVTNITKAKLVEKALLENEAKFRLYVENSPVAVFVANTEGKYEYVNEAASELLGYSTKELRGMSIQQVIFDGEPKVFSEVKNAGRSACETVLRSKDGLPVFVILNSVRLPDGKLMAFCENITERKKTEDKLRESIHKNELINEKLGVVGSLTRHDVGNKLMVVKSNLYLLKKQIGDNPKLAKYLEGIDSAIKSSDEMFEFSRFYEKIGVEGSLRNRCCPMFQSSYNAFA